MRGVNSIRITVGLVAVFLTASCMSSDGVGGTSSEVVSTDMTAYAAGSNVIVSWTGLDGAADDWISIGLPGDAGTSYTYWQYTGGGASGSITFTGVAAGTWEARAFNSWGGTHSYTPQFRSAPFTVSSSGTPSVTTDASTYASGTPMTISWTNLPGLPQDWVAIANQGSPNNSYWAYVYTGGAVTGNHVFTDVLPPGTYVARAFPNNTYTLLAESAPFTITGGTTTTLNIAGPSPAAGVGFTVDYTGMPGSATDWVGIAYAGTPDTSYVASAYTGGTANGSVSFGGLAAGNYEARAYYNWPSGGYTVHARFAFRVVAAHFMTLGGYNRTSAYAVSADGTYVVGFGDMGHGTPRRAALWSAQSGVHIEISSTDSIAKGVSNGGNVVGGWNGSAAFRWTSGGYQAIGDLAGGAVASATDSVVADGNMLVGYSSSTNGQEAFSWTSSGGMIALGDLTGGTFESEAIAGNHDGSIIVGYGTDATGHQAVSWTGGGAPVGLGTLSGGSPVESYAYGISDDGTTIVGRSNSSNGPEAFRWTSGGGMVGLGDLPGGTFASYAFDASADGSVVVGLGNYSAAAGGGNAFIWDATNGMRDLATVVDALPGVDLTGWTLDTAYGISADGKTIVGISYDPGGNRLAFVAVL